MFRHRNFVLRFQRFLLTWFIPLLYSLLNFFRKCFDFKISHLGSNDYTPLFMDPKWNFCLDWKHNIVLAFWESKSSYFCSIKIMILAFLGKYSNIVCWVSKCVCWGSYHLVSELLGSKIRFTILLPFVSCYHSIFFRLCSLFLVLCFVLCTKLKKRKEKVILKHQVEKKKRWYWSNRYYHSIFSKLVYSWIVTL